MNQSTSTSHMASAYMTPSSGPPAPMGHYAPYQQPLLQPGPASYPSAPSPYSQHQYGSQYPAPSSLSSGSLSASAHGGGHAFDTTGQIAPPGMEPRVTSTLWEDDGALCFQVEAKGVCVARREDNHMINGTKLLNVAGMTRGRRDGILKSEKTRQVVKIGPMHLKGVWIPFDRALDFANKEKITELLYPLFVHDIGALLYHPSNHPRPGMANPSALVAAPLQQGSAWSTTSPLTPDVVQPKVDKPGNLSIELDINQPNSPPSPVGLSILGSGIEVSLPDSGYCGSPRWVVNRRSSADAISTLADEPSSSRSIVLHKHESRRRDHTSEEHSMKDIRTPETDVTSTTQDTGSSTSSTTSETPMSRRKRLIVDRLMQQFMAIFSSCSRSPRIAMLAHGQHQHESTTSLSLDHTNNKASSSDITGLNKAQKRKKQSTRGGDDGAESDEEPVRKTSKPKQPCDGEVTKRLACPYFKRNPWKYQQHSRSCTGPGFDTVHRLKEHLYRLHKLPMLCPRCPETFGSEDLITEHLQQDPPCTIQKRPVLEGLTKDQERRLKSRKRTEPNDVSEEDKWRIVYKILFPYDDHDKLPSPYYEYEISNPDDGSQSSMAALEEYEAYLRQELPYSVRNEMETRLDNILSDAEVGLRTQLRTIVRDLQIAHFQDFLQQRGLRTEPSIRVQQSPQTTENVDNVHQTAPLSAIQDSDTTQSAAPALAVEPNADAQIPATWFPGFDGAMFDFPSELASDSGFFSFSADAANLMKLDHDNWNNVDLGNEEYEPQ